jgi:hypothetical protein
MFLIPFIVSQLANDLSQISQTVQGLGHKVIAAHAENAGVFDSLNRARSCPATKVLSADQIEDLWVLRQYHRNPERTLPSRRHVCTSKAGPATARTRVLRIHQVNRTKEKLD